MKITGVRYHQINIPFEAPMLWSGGVNRSWTRVVVRVETDEGIEGVGETVGWDPVISQIEQLKDFFIGEDPFDRERILKNFWYVPTYHGNAGKYAIQALETACYDIMGKATNRPLCQLLGARHRTKIPMIAYMFFRDEGPDGRGGELTGEALVETTRELVERGGLRTIKLKGGVFPPDEEYEATVAMREAFPDAKLRFDPNSLWSVETAVRIGKKMEALDLEFYEDPVWGIEGMRRVRQKVDLPLATNMCTLDLDEIPQTIRLEAIDVQLLDPADWGGVGATMKAAATYGIFQIGCGFHSGGEAGGSTALQLQLAAALPVLPYAVDSHYHHQTADYITKPFQYVDGCFELPEGPGLGIEIDGDQLARLEELHRREGDVVFIGDDRLRADPKYMGMW
jgi:glucarate dehydratase